MTIEGAVNTYNVLKENDFKITGESLLSAGTTLLSAAATVAGFKALGSSVRETTALIRSGAACFTVGTLVLTENGQKAIEDIQAGDKVYATDPETGESGYKEVLQTFEKETEVVVHVTYEKDEEGSNAETTTVNTTLNHRFWTEDGWKSAGTLEAGDKLTLADGNTATVTNVAYEDTHATVYNFEVEDFHTYYVGTESVLVHNNGGNCMKTASALAQRGSKGGSNPSKLLPGEGNIGTYKDLIKAGKRGDNITPHHMPSAGYMKLKGVANSDGLAMNMEMPSPGTGGRHRLTDTYGGNMTPEQRAYYYSLSPRDALAYDIKNVREIYQSQGLYSQIRPQLQQYIKEYKTLMPELFEK